MARTARTFSAPLRLTLAALAVGVVPSLAATVDPVPMPHLRPGGANASAAAAAAVTTAARPPVNVNFNANSPFTRDQQVLLANINAYFNSFNLMEGQFIQFGPSGEQSEGIFFLNKPGKIRFHYRPPNKLDVISDGSSVAIKDGKTNTQDLYPLGKTPLRYLLSRQIDLTSPNLVSAVKEEADLISVIIVERSGLTPGQISLIFDRKSFALRRWVVTDAQGLNTSVDIFNTTIGKPQDPNLFRISVN